jgi:hypothetical protein
MNDVAVALEHVNLLDGLDGLGVQLLEGRLQLLVVVGAALNIALLLVPRSTLSTYRTSKRTPSVSLVALFCRCRIDPSPLLEWDACMA